MKNWRKLFDEISLILKIMKFVIKSIVIKNESERW
jgi:hypothetical protein